MRKVTLELPESVDEMVEFLNNPLALEYQSNIGIFTAGVNQTIFIEAVKRHLLKKKPLPWFVEEMLRVNFKLSHSQNTKDMGRGSGNPPSKHEAFPYIPLPAVSFLHSMAQAIELVNKTEINAVDAGCGCGDKVYLGDIFFNSYKEKTQVYFWGIEYNPYLISVCNFIHPVLRNSIKKGDITSDSFEKCDIIYAYNPMVETKGMAAFFRNVIKTAKIGTVCVFHNIGSGEDALEQKDIAPHFKPINDHLYILK